jgi:hypothetical protein
MKGHTIDPFAGQARANFYVDLFPLNLNTKFVIIRFERIISVLIRAGIIILNPMSFRNISACCLLTIGCKDNKSN